MTSASSGSTVTPFRWVGQLGYYRQGDTADYWLRARLYRELAGRFVSRDPAGQGNGYSWPGNGPVQVVDPSGQVGCRPGAAVGGGGAPAGAGFYASLLAGAARRRRGGTAGGGVNATLGSSTCTNCMEERDFDLGCRCADGWAHGGCAARGGSWMYATNSSGRTCRMCILGGGATYDLIGGPYFAADEDCCWAKYHQYNTRQGIDKICWHYGTEGIPKKCGPDITDALRRTLNNVRGWIEVWAKDYSKYEGMCAGLFNPLRQKDYWDIGDIFGDGVGFSYYRQVCGTNSCIGTALVNGWCYKAVAVNYVLFGILFHSCETKKYAWWPSVDVEYLPGIWCNASGDCECKKAWAWAGYQGWTGSDIHVSDPTSCARTDCPSCHLIYEDASVFAFTWDGEINISTPPRPHI